MSSERKIVIILGAGSTFDNAESANDFEKPPLDKFFFRKTRDFLNKAQIPIEKRKELLYELEYVRAYFEIWHGENIFSDDEDSLENVMSRIFNDVIADSPKERPAFSVFIAFMKLLYDIIGETTNIIETNSGKPLYRIINGYLRGGINPENLTIISLNYDIYIEKTLAAVSRSFLNPDLIVFLLQNCYELGLTVHDITMAGHPKTGWFPVRLHVGSGGIKVLKLHGSLNWYSHFQSNKVGLNSMFNRDRILKITRELEIHSNKLQYRTTDGDIRYTLPVIVPPVKNKAVLHHSKILNLWRIAETILSEANELLIYGYSCPPLDYDSEELLRTSVGRNCFLEKISVIDPNTASHERYSELFSPKPISPYFTSESFLLDTT